MVTCFGTVMRWEEEHARLYCKYRLLLLGDYTLTTLDEEKFVFVRFSQKSYTEFAASDALRRIDYFHPASPRSGLLVALMTDDTEAYAKDMISTKGWIRRAFVKLQRQCRIHLRINRITNDSFVSQQLSLHVGIIRHIAQFMPESVVVADDEIDLVARDNWMQRRRDLSFSADVVRRRKDVRRRRNRGHCDEYLRRLWQRYLDSSGSGDYIAQIRCEEIRLQLMNERHRSRYWHRRRMYFRPVAQIAQVSRHHARFIIRNQNSNRFRLPPWIVARLAPFSAYYEQRMTTDDA